MLLITLLCSWFNLFIESIYLVIYIFKNIHWEFTSQPISIDLYLREVLFYHKYLQRHFEKLLRIYILAYTYRPIYKSYILGCLLPLSVYGCIFLHSSSKHFYMTYIVLFSEWIYELVIEFYSVFILMYLMYAAFMNWCGPMSQADSLWSIKYIKKQRRLGIMLKYGIIVLAIPY